MRKVDGGLTHSSFLDDGPGDPRDRFITDLLGKIRPEGKVVAYSSYEASILRSLAEAFPRYRRRLLALRERIVDLLQLTRGSFSIKSAVSALVPDLVYDVLEIREGNSAVAVYGELIGGDLDQSNAAQIREALLAYCARDTEAMVRVYEALFAEVTS